MGSSVLVLLDESGDLGWKFGSPYRQGGSSRYLTIAATVVSEAKQHLPARVIKKLYEKYAWPTSIEKKWARMHKEERVGFAIQAKNLIEQHSDIHYFSITVYKPKVEAHIQKDANKLYNYKKLFF
jgi:hypothetical protein